MKKAIIYLTLFIAASVNLDSQAQTADNTGLSEAQKELLRERVLQKTEEFFSSLGKIVDNNQTHNTRMHHQTQLLNLFLGKGDAYDIVNEVGLTEHSDGVKMWTSSVNTAIKTPTMLRRYIRKLYNPVKRKSDLPYSKIKIQSADAVRVDNIEQEGDHYVCVAYFYQDFYGIRDGRTVYKDRTCKKIKCYINPIDVPGVGKIFDAKLGDITVISTQRI